MDPHIAKVEDKTGGYQNMTMCDSCMTPKPRRVVKVKDLLYGKSFTEYNLCENCFRKLFKQLDQNKAKMGGMK